jgi:hypothetical protein
MLDSGLHAIVSLTSAYVLALTRRGRSLLRSESVILLVDSLYAEAIETVKSQATLSASLSMLIWILGEINSEARL